MWESTNLNSPYSTEHKTRCPIHSSAAAETGGKPRMRKNGRPAASIPLRQLFQVDPQLLALLIEMASLQAQRLRGLRNLAAMPLELGQHLWRARRPAPVAPAGHSLARLRTRQPSRRLYESQAAPAARLPRPPRRRPAAAAAPPHCATRECCPATHTPAELQCAAAVNAAGFHPFCALTWRTKCSTSAGRSSRRWRSGGSSTGNTTTR